MNNKLLVVVLVIFALLLSALILRDGNVLLLAVPFLAYLGVAVAQAPSAIHLAAARLVSHVSASPREPVRCRLLVENRGPALVNLLLQDPVNPRLKIQEGSPSRSVFLPAGETAELEYVFRAARGAYSWSSVHAAAADPFGLFEVESGLPAHAETLILPDPVRLRHIPIRPRFTIHAAGPIPARLAGSGTDFWGVREYKSGDSLQRLNWRMLARHPRKHFTNEYEQEEIADFGLVLDAREMGSPGQDGALFEHAVQAASSISDLLLKEGNRVGLLVFGQSLAALHPAYGKLQRDRILAELARSKLGPYVSFEYLKYFPVRLFPARSILVVISPLSRADLETYACLRSAGCKVLLVSPNQVEYAASTLPPTQTNAVAVRLARIERCLDLKQLLRMGIHVVDWRVDQPLAESIRSALNHRAR